MASTTWRQALERRKRELEAALKPMLELQHELQEVDSLLQAYTDRDRSPERGGPNDR